jgi:hypothetical protein
MLRLTVRPAASIVLAGSLVLPFVLTGCSSTGDMTCAEFQGQGMAEQADTLGDLLSDHDLVSSDPGNIEGVTAAVSNLCASNSDATLDESANWDSSTW